MWRQAHPCRMLSRSCLALAVLLLSGAASFARAETVQEVWRSPFGLPRAVAVDAADHSLWVGVGSSVVHFAAGGELLGQADSLNTYLSLSAAPGGSCWVGFSGSDLRTASGLALLASDGNVVWSSDRYAFPFSLSADPRDGSCWLLDSSAVIHVAADGTELARLTGYDQPSSISVDPADGTCWLGVMGAWDWEQSQYVGSALVHLSASGTEDLRLGTVYVPAAVGASPTDGSCWLGHDDQIIHVSAAGEELARLTGTGYITTLSVDPADGSCWAGSQYGGYGATRVAADGTVLWQTPPDPPVGADGMAAATDGSCWMVDTLHFELLHFAADGSPLPGARALRGLNSLSVDTDDGSLWFQDGGSYRPGGGFAATRGHLAAAGDLLAWTDGYGPGQVAAAGGSAWIGENEPFMNDRAAVEQIDAAGAVLWSGGWNPWYGACVGVAANHSDGSAWFAYSNAEPGRALVHLDADGTELWHGDPVQSAAGLAVNSADGSIWIADAYPPQVVHLDADGSELWRGATFGQPGGLSVSSRDGSCWLIDQGTQQVIHLAADGTELWRGSFPSPESISVSSQDGTCWVSVGYPSEVVHLAADGQELWRGGEWLRRVTASELDGSLWAAHSLDEQLVHLVPISGPPGADFSAAATSGPAPLAVQFADTSLGYPTSWQWDFGDGATSAERHPLHYYLGAGPFTVSLTATNALGADTETKADYISIQRWFEEDDPALAYGGAWSPYSNAQASGGRMFVSSQSGAKVTFRFYGTGIRWRTALGPDMGKARLTIDQRAQRLLDLYRPQVTVTTQSRLGLRRGLHTLTLTVTALHNPHSTSTLVPVDAFEVIP